MTAQFADGSQAVGDLLIGADGIHSVIRSQLFPEVRLRYSGYVAWRGVVDFPDGEVNDHTSESWGSGGRFGIVPVGQGRVYWFATANLPEGFKPAPAERKAMLHERFRDWHTPIPALIEATPADKILYNDILDFPPLTCWSLGRVTLLGDAVHPTTPNLGQGACQAIESSLILARCLANAGDLRTALDRYAAERMRRTAWITNQSWQLGRLAQIENPLLCALRNVALRLTPARVMLAQLHASAGYEIP